MSSVEPQTLILGAGIIGLSTAYYLSLTSPDPSAIHLLDAAPALLTTASGYAGGFLASDWFSAPTASLGALSFALHAELAAEFNGRERWGYSRSTGTSLTYGDGGGRARGDDWLREGGSRAEARGAHEFVEGLGPSWLIRGSGDEVEVISNAGTAQVDPKRLCEFLLEKVRGRGVSVRHPVTATGIVTGREGEVTAVKVEEEGRTLEMPCSKLVMTAGPWTPRVFAGLFPESKTRLPISSLAGHSIVVRSPRWSAEHEDKGCHAVFATEADGFSPEVFSRIGGDIYVAGLNEPGLELASRPGKTPPDPKAVERLKKVAKRMLGVDEEVEVVREGLCFRPVGGRGPIIGRVPRKVLGGAMMNGTGDSGVFVAAGHGPWGISQSLGTGKVMAELIVGHKPSVDIHALELK